MELRRALNVTPSVARRFCRYRALFREQRCFLSRRRFCLHARFAQVRLRDAQRFFKVLGAASPSMHLGGNLGRLDGRGDTMHALFFPFFASVTYTRVWVSVAYVSHLFSCRFRCSYFRRELVAQHGIRARIFAAISRNLRPCLLACRLHNEARGC